MQKGIELLTKLSEARAEAIKHHKHNTGMNVREYDSVYVNTALQAYSLFYPLDIVEIWDSWDRIGDSIDIEIPKTWNRGKGSNNDNK